MPNLAQCPCLRLGVTSTYYNISALNQRKIVNQGRANVHQKQKLIGNLHGLF